MILFAALALPFLIWLAIRLMLPSQAKFNMDQGNHKGSFFPLLVMYQVMAYVVLVMSAGGVILSSSQGDFWTAILFSIALFEALTFNVLITVYYEAYLHWRDAHNSSNYTSIRYAIVMSLAASSVITFGTSVVLYIFNEVVRGVS